MKRKLLFLLLAPMSLSFLPACHDTSGLKLTLGTYITTDDKDETDAVKIDANDLFEKMDSDSNYSTENFLLAVAPTNGCSCWSSFTPILKQFIKETHYLVYQINVPELSTESYGIPHKEGHVSFAIIRSGRVIKSYMSSPIFDSVESLKAEINKYVRAPEIYYISQDMLDTYKNGETTLITYVRNACSDCSFIMPKHIYPYVEKHNLKAKMYVFDMQELYEGDSLDYQEFKDTNYLSSLLNEDLGYGKGVVPTFHNYERGVLIDASVTFNDKVEKVGDEFKITESFYSKARIDHIQYGSYLPHAILEGLTLSADEVNYNEEKNRVSFPREKAYKYHAPLLDAFLNKYAI